MVGAILFIEVGRRHVMSLVPARIGQLAVRCEVVHDLFFCDFEACRIAHRVRVLVHSSSLFASEWRITINSGNRRPHLSENSVFSWHPLGKAKLTDINYHLYKQRLNFIPSGFWGFGEIGRAHV